MEWISVKDRLPELDERVLIVLSNGIMKVDERFVSPYDSARHITWRYTYPTSNITHWMPLPEPPKP